MKNGTMFYDERNDRYLTLDGYATDPKVWHCIIEELDEYGEYTITGVQLFHENELLKFKEV